MAKKAGSSKKGKSQVVAAQLSFDFVVEQQPRPQAVVVTAVEVLPPVDRGSRSDPSSLSEGALEHAYLRHRADKYEDRAVRALLAFMISAIFSVLLKSGIPVSQAALEKVGLPVVSNARLLAGMLGGATFVSALVCTFYALRMRQYSVQLDLPLVRSSLAGMLATVLFGLCVVVVVAMFLAVVYLTWRDVLHLVTYVWERQFYILDGWEPVKTSK